MSDLLSALTRTHEPAAEKVAREAITAFVGDESLWRDLPAMERAKVIAATNRAIQYAHIPEATIAALAVVAVGCRKNYAQLLVDAPDSISGRIEQRDRLAVAQKALDESTSRLVHAVDAYLRQ